MGSLFRVREWSSIKLEDEHGFDCNSLVVCNIDNAADAEDKIIVGSLGGVLRLYKSHIDAFSSNNQQPLLEVDLGLPILALASGRFLPSSDSLHLLILHPRKVCVYSLSGTAGLSAHGCSHNILLIYEHILQHSAYNVVAGPFGQAKGKDFICVQSLDGTLSFFEQEIFTFRRVLPNHLLPGPLDYCSATDSFIVASSSRTIECYRYQIIAIAKESGSAADGEKSTSGGRRVVADWNIVLGETVIDLRVLTHEKRTFIVVLGERNLFVTAEDGSPFFVKKFDFSPVAMFPYMNGDTLMTLIVTEFSTLLCFAHHSLKWAAQMSFTAVAVRRAQITGVPGVIVALSDSGDLSSCYLGTNPSLSLVSVPMEHTKIDYEEAERELQELKRIIRSFQDDGTGLPVTGRAAKSLSSQVRVNIAEARASELGTEKTLSEKGGVIYQISVSPDMVIHKVRLSIDLPKPLKSNRRTFAVDTILPNASFSIFVNVYVDNNDLPANLTMTVTLVFYNELEAPRVMTKVHHLPFSLVAKLVAPPSDSGIHCISLGVVSNSSIRMKELFSDMPNVTAEDGFCDIGFDLANNLVAVNAQSRGSQCKVTIRSASFLSLAFVAVELIQRLRSLGIRFDPAILDKQSLPLPLYFDLIDNHLTLRHEIINLRKRLSEQAAQFRAIEKRFLIKLKDRNPAASGEIDHLITFEHSKITGTTEAIIEAWENHCVLSAQLATMTTLVVQMVSIIANMKSDQLNQIRALLDHSDCSGADEVLEGWEERAEAALTDFLGPSADIITPTTRFSDFKFSIADDTLVLHDLVSRLIDGALRRDMATGKTAESTSSSSPPPGGSTNKTTFLHPTTEIIHEEEEGEDEPQSG